MNTVINSRIIFIGFTKNKLLLHNKCIFGGPIQHTRTYNPFLMLSLEKTSSAIILVGASCEQ